MATISTKSTINGRVRSDKLAESTPRTGAKRRSLDTPKRACTGRAPPSSANERDIVSKPRSASRSAAPLPVPEAETPPVAAAPAPPQRPMGTMVFCYCFGLAMEGGLIYALDESAWRWVPVVALVLQVAVILFLLPLYLGGWFDWRPDPETSAPEPTSTVPSASPVQAVEVI
jgi:hypothetical protein